MKGRFSNAFVDALLEPGRRIRKNPRRLLQAPESAVSSIRSHAERAMETLIDRVGPEGVRKAHEELALELVRSGIDFDTARRLAREELRADQAADCLFAIIRAADVVFPLAPIVLTANPASAARARLWASAALEEARRARGERRRRLACVAAGLVTEGAYRTYVVKLWVMCQLARRRAEEPVVPAYGVALGQVAKWIAAYPMLVDADAARIRNAIHHHHFEYPGRTIRLWDNRGWGLETDATELIERASTMLTVTWAFQTAMNTYLFCSLSEIGVAPVFNALALSAEDRLTSAHESRIASDVEARMEAALGAIPAALWSLHGAGEDLGGSPLRELAPRRAPGADALPHGRQSAAKGEG